MKGRWTTDEAVVVSQRRDWRRHSSNNWPAPTLNNNPWGKGLYEELHLVLRQQS